MMMSQDYLKRYAVIIADIKTLGLGRNASSTKFKEMTGIEIKPHIMKTCLKNVEKYLSQKKEQKEEENPIHEPEYDIEDLLREKIKIQDKKNRAFQRHRKSLNFPHSEPMGFIIFGDPHLDDNSCDIRLLIHHINACKQDGKNHPNIIASTVGDILNSWIGRLIKLYKNQKTTVDESWILAEWFFEQFDSWLIVGGNHDSWTIQYMDPFQWIADKSTNILAYAPDELKVTIKWKDVDIEPIVWVIRHDFSGRSLYHPTHGPNREAQLSDAHLLSAGHIHQWGILTTEQRNERITTSLRVRGYKRNDKYAIQKGFYEQKHGASCFVVMDPMSPPESRISVFWNIEKGVEYLDFLLSKRKRLPKKGEP